MLHGDTYTLDKADALLYLASQGVLIPDDSEGEVAFLEDGVEIARTTIDRFQAVFSATSKAGGAAILKFKLSQ